MAPSSRTTGLRWLRCTPTCHEIRHNSDISCPGRVKGGFCNETVAQVILHEEARISEAADIDLTVVTGVFDAAQGRESELAGVLARYVVVTRGEPGCRNVDLVASLLQPGRFLVYEKWDSPEAQAAHMAGPSTTEMAGAASTLLSGPPDLGLFAAVSAHDLL